MADPQHPTTGRAGFSLLAILCWLCGVAVLSLVAIPYFFNRPDVTLWHVVELLARDLRSAQNHSAYQKAPTTFHFTVDGWTTTGADGMPLGRNLGEPVIERSFGDIFRGVEIIRIDFGEDDAVVFDSAGRAEESGEVEVAFRGQTHTLQLEEGSGLTKILGPEGVLQQDDRRVNLDPAERP